MNYLSNTVKKIIKYTDNPLLCCENNFNISNNNLYNNIQLHESKKWNEYFSNAIKNKQKIFLISQCIVNFNNPLQKKIFLLLHP